MRDVEETQEIKPVFECLAGDTVFFPLTFFGERDIILRKNAYTAILKETVKKYGSGFRALLYYVSMAVDSEAHDEYTRMLKNNA